MNRRFHDRAYYRAFYETPPRRLARAGAAAALAWALQWLLLVAALILGDLAIGDPVGHDALAAVALLAPACALLAWRLLRPMRR